MDAGAQQRMDPITCDATVVVALSGGVDSSVAAALLTERGYSCIGVMMRLWAEREDGEGSGNRCCDDESVDDARRVADRLGMPFYLINVEQTFKRKVVDYFIEGYGAGLTPNPCLACNRHIRFDYLLNYARRLGARFLATGHYARLRRQPDGSLHLLRGVDAHKDQSYVLSMLGQEELKDLLFPVGDYAKEDVRRMAASRGLPVHSKHDSMDLCFVEDDDYRRFLTDWAPAAMTPGEMVDIDGNALGMHRGLPNYTIGQRKGLGLGGMAFPLYVTGKDRMRNRLVVGPAEALGSSELNAEGVHWTSNSAPEPGSRMQCQIRYAGRPHGCTIFPLGDERVRVLFDVPVRGIGPGQGAVFYDGDRCLGGGIIAAPHAEDEGSPVTESTGPRTAPHRRA